MILFELDHFMFIHLFDKSMLAGGGSGAHPRGPRKYGGAIPLQRLPSLLHGSLLFRLLREITL